VEPFLLELDPSGVESDSFIQHHTLEMAQINTAVPSAAQKVTGSTPTAALPVASLGELHLLSEERRFEQLTHTKRLLVLELRLLVMSAGRCWRRRRYDINDKRRRH